MSKEVCKLFLKAALFQEFHSYIKNANLSIENLTNNGELETCDRQLLPIPSLLPVPRKKYFSPREIIVIAGF